MDRIDNSNAGGQSVQIRGPDAAMNLLTDRGLSERGRNSITPG